MKTLTLLLSALLIFSSCGSESDPDDSQISKSEAAALDGKSDSLGDICEVMGWYGDGECDSFCSKPDVDDCFFPCDDDSLPVNFCAPPQPCDEGLVSARKNGCKVCVDPITCEVPPLPRSCDDDSTPVNFCAPPEPCTDGLVIARNQGCLVCVDPNTCEPPPINCDDDSKPVEFCASPEPCTDGLIQAHHKGCQVCVDPLTCKPPTTAPDTCGGIAGLLCADDQVCIKPAGMCNVADGAGTCVTPGDVCPAVVDPVCGCDGVTYNNSCEATRAGASVDSRGACGPPTGDLCGGIAGILCSDDQVCIFEPGTCNVADRAGSCVTPGDVCPAVVDPVCGCDGITYNNKCEANKRGAAIDKEGPC